ncbi:MAG: TolC family protein [Chloroflexi bacterium]|nr:TolC family protein [Chloroflexota bacterium]
MKKLLLVLLVIVVIIISASAPGFAQPLLTLDAAVNSALTDNRELAAARMRIEEAKARLVQAGLLPNPELGIAGRFDSAFRNEGEHTFGFDLTQPFSVSGRIGGQKGVASVDIERTLAEVANLERRVVGEVRREFTELFTAEEQIKLQEFLIGLNEELLTAMKAAMVRGQVSEKDVNTIRIALQQARQRQRVLETQRRSRLLELNKLLGKQAEFDFIAVGKLEVQALPELSEFVPAKALDRRPDYVGAQLDVDLARSEQRLTKAERFEDWRIGMGYERDQSVVDGAPSQGVDQFVGLKLSIPLPLFDRKQGRILETLALEDRAQKSAEALKLQIEQELADALNRMKTLASLLESYEPGILKRAESNVKLVEDGYRQGLTNIVEVIQCRQQFAELKSSYIDTLAEYQRAVIDLEIAAGIFPCTIKLKHANENEVNSHEKSNQ